MNVVYYDVLENLIKDFKKILNKNVKLDEPNKEIIVDNQNIKYKEIDIALRSFSKPFFINNEIELDLSNCDDNLRLEICNMCNAYTDNELKAIVEKMPILFDFSNSRKDELKGVAIIWRDHFLEDNIGLLTAFMRMGVDARDILVMDKGDETKHRKEITATFKKLGFQVEILDNNLLDEKPLLEKGERIINKFINDRKDKKVLILDDGAIISKILINKKYDNVKAIVELTEMGLRRIRKIKNKELLYPVLNVAKTDLKKYITYREISNTIFTRIIELLGDEKLVGRTVIQLGYGDLGGFLAKRLLDYGVRVVIVDTNIMKLIQASEEGLNTYRTLDEAMKYEKPFMIIGASGEQSISREAVLQLEDDTYVTAGATADLSIFKEFEKKGVKHKFIKKYGTQYEINNKRITVLGNGRSVNLFDSESIPNKSIDLFKTGTLLTAYMGIKENNLLEKSVQLDIVNEWIYESNILEKYYDLYFSKK